MRNLKRRIIPLSLCVSMILGSQLFGSETTLLEEIKVSEEQSSFIADNVTEGTGSYTTKSMKTATKLDLSPRETPQSVKVLTKEYLDDTNITSYQELLSNVTGVSLNRWDERIYPTARGFDIDYYLLDGVPTYNITSSTASDMDLSLYDRVEVVKGANGLMTGAGNPAIGLNFIRKHANSKEFTGTVDLSAGSWEAYSSTVDIQTPLNEDGTIRARVVAKHEDKNSFMDNYEKTNDVFYGVLDMDLTDTTYFSLAGSYENLDRTGVRWGGLPAFYSDFSKTNFDRSTIVSEDWTYWNTETRSLYADFKQYLLDDISLNLSYTNRKLFSDTNLLYFGGTVNKSTGVGEGYVYGYTNDTLSQEQNIDANISAPFEFANLKHEIVFGAMHNKSNLKYNNWGQQYYISSLSNPLINFNNIDISDPNLSKNISVIPDETTQSGVYLAGKISLMEPLKLIAGARVSNWEYERDNNVGNREFKNEFTPYTGLILDIDKYHSLYASYTDIFKPQENKDPDGNYLDPKVGENYETGIKAEYFDKKLNTTLSVFRIEQDKVAEKINGVFVVGTTDSAYRAVDGVVSKGIEFEIDGEITDNWNMSFGIANFEAKDADGNKVTTTSSRTTANLFTKYKVNNKFSFGGGLNYKSKLYTEYNDIKMAQDAYIIANAMVAYNIDKNLKLQLNVNNIFDKEYYESVGEDAMNYGDPRNATISMKYTF